MVFGVASLGAVIISPLPYIFQNGTVADATQVNADLAQIVNNVNANAAAISQLPPAFTVTAPSITVFVTGSSATYTTPVNSNNALPTYLDVKMLGGGGGGGGSGSGSPTSGANGNNSSFGAFGAGGGQGGHFSQSTTGGAGGSGQGGSCTLDIGGQAGEPGAIVGGGAPISIGSRGGATALFGPTLGSSGGGNVGFPGSGGGGGSSGNVTQTGGASGGGSEYCWVIVTSPATSYTYTVGTGGAGGSAGTNGFAGGNGANGIIIVEARWQ